jgi:hypothetical protein
VQVWRKTAQIKVGYITQQIVAVRAQRGRLFRQLLANVSLMGVRSSNKMIALRKAEAKALHLLRQNHPALVSAQMISQNGIKVTVWSLV